MRDEEHKPEEGRPCGQTNRENALGYVGPRVAPKVSSDSDTVLHLITLQNLLWPHNPRSVQVLREAVKGLREADRMREALTRLSRFPGNESLTAKEMAEIARNALAEAPQLG
jgi:hypothetical protein